MKFCWFNLMPWPYMPETFRQDHRSVWVDIDQKLFDPVKSNEVYNTYMDQLEFADELGFDAIGVNVLSPFRALTRSCTFVTTATLDASTAFVITDSESGPIGNPVVVHRIQAP